MGQSFQRHIFPLRINAPSFKQILLVLITFNLLSWPSSVQSTPAEWRAWLHDQHGHLVMVDHKGNVIDEVWLVLPEDLSMIGNPVVSTDGRRMTLITAEPDGDKPQRLLFDTRDSTLLPMPAPNEQSTAAAFDETGRLLAYSGADNALIVVDTENGEIQQRLDLSVADLPASLQSAAPFVPVIHRFADQSIWFSMASEQQSARSVSYRWDLITNHVSETFAYAQNPSDTFAATGEVATVAQTADRILIYEPLTHALFTFYHDPSLEFQRPGVWFVENGKRLLVQATQSTAEHQVTWLLLNRDGTLERPLRDVERRTIHGTADGFIYMLAHDGISELIHTATESLFSDRSLWQAEGLWEVVWVDTGADSFGPYMPWSISGDPVYDVAESSRAINPTPLPTGLPLLAAGMDVYVNTNGDVLYLRDAPGLNSTILQYLYDRDVVTLLEGPVAQDGYRWWRIRTEDGAEGWAAEVSGDVSTLLPERPPRIIATATPNL